MLEHLLALLDRELLGNTSIRKIVKKVEQEGDRFIQGGEAIIDTENVTAISGYSHDGLPSTFFFNRETRQQSFEDLQHNFVKPFILYSFVQPEYECHTEIEDGMSEELKDTWAVAGRGEAKILAVYPTKEEMEKCKEEIFLKAKGWALVHQIGTTVYTLVNTDCWIYNV